MLKSCPAQVHNKSHSMHAVQSEAAQTCMCVRSMSVGCVNSVAQTAATAPDVRLVTVLEAPSCKAVTPRAAVR